MGAVTEIYWCDSTHNTHIGCQEVSEGCDNCYARIQSERWHQATWGDPKSTIRVVTKDANWRKPVIWNKRVAEGDTNWNDKTWRAPVRPNTLRRLVFTNSLSDIFEHTAQLDPVRLRLWKLVEETPYLDWLLLTKRPQNVRRMIPQSWLQNPQPNVWLGTSVELQKYAETRIPYLLNVPAVVHFISAEPLLGPLNLRKWQWGLDWVITGGESGAHHRPLDLDWVGDIDQQCRDARIAHFFKQVGGRTHAEGGCLLDGVEVKEFPRTRAPEPLRRAM